MQEYFRSILFLTGRERCERENFGEAYADWAFNLTQPDMEFRFYGVKLVYLLKAL